MARQMERVENLARILDVNESFARDNHGEQEWLPIVQLNADEEAFFARNVEASADATVHFYLIDRENPNSVIQCVWAARENARSLRHLLSIEVWSQLNVFYRFVADLRRRDLRLTELSHLCQEIKEGCQLHAGIVEGTTYRDQGHTFYQLGKFIDRADQTSRMLDIKYQRLLPRVSEVGSAIDVSQWNALLRSVAGYHGYRRVHASGLTPESVAEFILLNPVFPRSVVFCVRQIRHYLDVLARDPELTEVSCDVTSLEALEALNALPIKTILSNGLHEHLDQVQINLIGLSNAIAVAYFGADRGEMTASAQ